MFANLLPLIARGPAPGGERGFVQEVRRPPRAPRNPQVGRVVFACWLLIAGKCGLVVWLVHRYGVPFNPLWVNGPTVLFALLGTAVYFGRP
jgi:hypothetical protein